MNDSELMIEIMRNKFHKRFEEYFQASYISQEFYFIPNHSIENISWDYGIYNKHNNELAMLVDLESMYKLFDIEEEPKVVPENIKYHIIYEGIKFKDSFESMIKNLMLNYDDFVAYQFYVCRTSPFPSPRYNNKTLMDSYQQLVKMKPVAKYSKDKTLNNREGDKIITHFHPSIFYARRKGSKLSPYDAYHDDELLLKVIQNRIIYVPYLNPNKILQGFNIAKVAQKVSVFSAGRAKILIYRYLNDYDTIFDPFSGFSARLLGTVSLNKKYIGQDISELHVKESNDIINHFGLNLLAEVKVADSLKSTGTYDCLFTCPPYGDKEEWLNVPLDFRSCDEWIDICLNNFKCKKYLFVVDDTKRYKEFIVDAILNKSHFGSNNEHVILINKEL